MLSGSTHNSGFQERIICYILYKDDDYIVFLFRNKSILILILILTYGIYNLEAIIRKQTFGYIGRLRTSCNTIVQTLENVWIIRIRLWHTWFEVLYTNR